MIQAMTLLAVQRPGRSNIFSICRPNTGQSYFEMPVRTCRCLPGQPLQGIIMPGVPACQGVLCLCNAVTRAAKRHQAGMGLVRISWSSNWTHIDCATRASCRAQVGVLS